MLKSCSYCGGMHQRGQHCPSKPKQVYKVTYIDRFRKGRQWQKKRKDIVERDKYLCQICIRERHNTQLKYNFTNIEVHHITPVNEDWDKRLDQMNLISLCSYHHHMAERGAISRGELFDIVEEQEKQ